MLGAGDQGVEGQNWDGPCDNDKVREFPIMVLPICITGLTLVVTSLSSTLCSDWQCQDFLH